MKLARNTSYKDQTGIGKARRMQAFVVENRSDAERLKEEVEAGDDVAKIASVLGVNIVDRVRLGGTDNPSQLLPQGMAEELEYAEHKWYRNGERVARYNSNQSSDGHKTILEADDEFVNEWLGDLVLLMVENQTHYHGINPNSDTVGVWIEPEE